MTADPTAFRPLARMGWGGRAASHFRGNPVSALPRGQNGTVIFRSPGVRSNFQISGVTRDSTGALLAGCRVELFITARDVSIAETVSGADGAFRFDMPGTGPFYLIAYKPGSPDVAATSINTLLPDAA